MFIDISTYLPRLINVVKECLLIPSYIINNSVIIYYISPIQENVIYKKQGPSPINNYVVLGNHVMGLTREIGDGPRFLYITFSCIGDNR